MLVIEVCNFVETEKMNNFDICFNIPYIEGTAQQQESGINNILYTERVYTCVYMYILI